MSFWFLFSTLKQETDVVVLMLNSMDSCKAQWGRNPTPLFVQRLPWGHLFPSGVNPRNPPVNFYSVVD